MSDLTLWPACVRRHALSEQIAAAASAGFAGLAINSATYVETLARGTTAGELARMARDSGVSFRWVDAVTGWLPTRYPADRPELRAFLDHDLDVAFEMADALGVGHLLAIGCFEEGSISGAELQDRFGALCERAGRAGVSVGLEFIPFWGIPDLAAAWDVCGTVAGSGAGLVIDTWHLVRSGGDADLLGSIPSGRVLAVQVADALALPPDRGLLEDCLGFRRLPGDGSFDLAPILARLLDEGVTDFGPEIFSDELDRRSAAAAAKACGDATRRVLSAAGEARGGASRQRLNG